MIQGYSLIYSIVNFLCSESEASILSRGKGYSKVSLTGFMKMVASKEYKSNFATDMSKLTYWYHDYLILEGFSGAHFFVQYAQFYVQIMELFVVVGMPVITAWPWCLNLQCRAYNLLLSVRLGGAWPPNGRKMNSIENCGATKLVWNRTVTSQ